MHAVGWIACVRVLGDTFNIRGFFTLHLILVILMCTTWVVLITLTGMAFWRGKIFFASEEDVVRDAVGLPDPEKGHSEKPAAHGHGH
jgi:hypothetical protein